MHEHTPRISHVLPTVKCSSCAQPVPLAALGDHVCPPFPTNKPPVSPRPAPALLPHRLQPRVAGSDTPPHTSSSEKQSEPGERILAPSRDPFQRPPPDKSSMAIPTTNAPLPRASPRSFDRDPPQSPRPPDPPRDPITHPLQRVRTPSNATRPTPPSPARPVFPLHPPDPATHQPPARPAALSSARREPSTHQPLTPPPPSSFPVRAPSSAAPTLNHRPLFESAPTMATIPISHSSHDKSRPSLAKLRLLDARRPSPDPNHLVTVQDPPTPSTSVRPPRAVAPALIPGTVPFPSSVPTIAPPISARQPPPPPQSLASPYARGMVHEIDTKIGGEAGMAGVGRRGFAAVARAAMFATSRSPSHQPAHAIALGDGHRINVPRYLNTNAIALSHAMRAAVTPPLSPNSAQTSSPVSPLPASPDPLGNDVSTNGPFPNLPSPHDAISRQSTVPTSIDKVPLPFPPSDVRIASPSRSPSPIPNPFERRLSGETVSQSPMSDPHLTLPFLDALKPGLDHENESDDESVYTTISDSKKDENLPPSPSADSDVGLAYARDSDDDTPVVMPLDIRKSTVNEGMNKVKFPTAATSDRSHPSGPSRQLSAASLRSAKSAHSTTSFAGHRARSTSTATHSTVRSIGALERAMETLIEEGASVSILASGSVLASIGGSGSASGRGVGKPSRSNTVPGPAPPEQKAPKLPTRSHTNPSHPHVHSERVGLTGEVARIRNRGPAKQKNRICARCSSKIEDGRWIPMDGGNVLCERCWKNMYLPKCRRCNLPIEKQAVSSRDGQLKGKYHRDCFNCYTCQKPFPDKEFYVFDGKPLCAYHYHEANNSLCGASSCGQPIEGPCAVTHSGKRYHPEHLLCEFEDGCKERLEEYWEVDGQMLCERHAALIGSCDGGWARAHDPAFDTQTKKPSGTEEGRMTKRMTRFIDLGGGGDDELDIR